MKCGFCGRQLNPGVIECPYCHYQLKVDAQVLSADERDTFEGITIDENGNTSSDKRKQEYEYQENGTYDDDLGRGPLGGNPFGNIKVKRFSLGSSLLTTVLIILALLALVLFFLPAFLVFFAIGAVIGGIMYLVRGLF